MGSEMQVPTVTVGDLWAFQVQHFPETNGCHGPQEEIFDDASATNDDDLGYYSGGVKRTLTDEQIAMFRHSEIYALIRERQVRRENQEENFGPQVENVLWRADSASQKLPTSADEGMDDIVDAGDGDEEEYVRFLEAERRKAGAKYQRFKRKITSRDDYTPRRVARELDISVADEQMLNYDEEPSKPTDNLKSSADIVDGPKQHLENSGTTTHQKRDPQLDGRKIWWPTIGEGQ